jgi:hypothetical protein
MRTKIEHGTEHINSNGGTILIGRLLGKSGLDREVNRVRVGGTVFPDYSNSACLRSYIGVLAEGRTAFEEIEPHRGGALFREALDLPAVPSSPTVRQRLDNSAGAFDAPLRTANLRLLEDCEYGQAETAEGGMVPLDLDVSCQDNSRTQKEGVSPTRQQYDGFAPMFAYLGTEGWMLDNELRPERQHCQKETPGFLDRCLQSAERLDCGRLLVRMDSGNDSEENMRVLFDRADFVIKRNLRQGSLWGWLELAREQGTASQPRPGKTVWRGSLWHPITDRDGEDNPVRLPSRRALLRAACSRWPGSLRQY